MSAAPGPLDVVRAYINTRDLESATDEWAGPEALRDWLAERDLVGAAQTVDASDLARARALREALRSLCRTNHGEPFDPASAQVLNDEATRSGVSARFDAMGNGVLASGAGTGFDAALGRIVSIVFTAMADGTWPRMKVCHDATCAWAFYDRSRNVSRQWCSMKVCGNRQKVRAFRERQRAVGD